MRKIFNKKAISFVTFVFFACHFCSCSEVVIAEQQNIIQLGWLEQVKLMPADIRMHAKLDTGADNCSIHANNIKRIKKGKKSYVQFEVVNRYGDRVTFFEPLVRVAKVKTKRGGAQSRAVVRMGICLADTVEYIECNLTDRSNFAYPVLIGRNFLAGNASVNSAETYTAEPTCLKDVEEEE